MALRLVVDNTAPKRTARFAVTVAAMLPPSPDDARLYSLWFTGFAHTAIIVGRLRAPDYTLDTTYRVFA